MTTHTTQDGRDTSAREPDENRTPLTPPELSPRSEHPARLHMTFKAFTKWVNPMTGETMYVLTVKRGESDE